MGPVGTADQLANLTDLKFNAKDYILITNILEFDFYTIRQVKTRKYDLLSCWLIDIGLFLLGGIPTGPPKAFGGGGATCCWAGGLLNRAMIESFDI